MAGQRVVLLVFLWWNAVHLTSASYDDDLKSPLDLSYIINDLGNLLPDSGSSQRSPGGAFVDSKQSSGGEDFPYSESQGATSGGTNGEQVEWSQGFNNAGDAQYDRKQRLGEYHTPDNDLRHSGDSGQGPSYTDTAFRPLDHADPPLAADRGSSQPGASLSSFGRSLTDTDYPIQVPTPSLHAQYSGDVVGNYVPQKRQLFPDPPSRVDVPYAVKQNTGDDYHDDGNDYPRRNQPYAGPKDDSDNLNYRQNVDEIGLVGRIRNQNPQGSYRPDGPVQDLSDTLFQNKPSSSDFSDHHPQVPHFHDQPAPHDHFDDGSSGFDTAAGHIGGGTVVDNHPFPGGVAGGTGGGAVGREVPGGGGQHAVVPQHGYPADVHHYRDQLLCWPQFFLQYNHDFSGAVWQDVKGHVRVHQGRAVFQGHGFLAIPFFACNDLLPRYSMIFVISPTYYSRGPQAVLGNSVFPGETSLLVVLEGHTLTLVVRQRAPNLTPQQLLAQCQKHHDHHHDSGYYGPADSSGPGFHSQPTYGHPTDVAHYGSTGDDIVVLQLRISGEVMVTVAQENDWIFFSAGRQHAAKAGRLPTLTNEALYVGAGADPRTGRTLDHYTGTFDSFLFEKCP